ncbi:L-rhamnose mutarotase [Rhodohalobacter sulfatireducens]|uniref:L-rhamnose mutarotase n=1 Tax=Rhodohalobacter sulfatireducens TaxID=2911366 RepID=A0ABS9KHS8_9BACT|nr:L-rhamnose mutarotase [Rhodohalobacter sulfatireducens]MCG2590403.1 L-rhamnose mutarotase [Rhodohalobacter sulfatireducens]
MKRFCFALDLKNDPELIDEYIKQHENVWPEILDSITNAGIINMEIYNVGNRLFMIMETTDDFDPEAKAEADQNNPKVQEWESLMNNYQKRLPFAKEHQKWVQMNRIFSLNKQRT